ncbi:MAG: BatD family protein [Candidatus Tectimicrobiota bacterium]
MRRRAIRLQTLGTVRLPGTRLLGQCALCWFLLLGILPCRLAAQDTTRPGQPEGQHKTLGPVHLRLVPDRQQMGLAEMLRLTLTVNAPPGFRVTLPELSHTLGPFTVSSQRTTGPTSVRPEAQQWQGEYMLTATSAGTLTLPTLAVTIQEGENRQSLQTDPLPVTVTTLLPADADPAALKDVAPPVSLVRPGLTLWPWWGAAGLLLLALGSGSWWVYRRWRQSRQATLLQRPAHLLALAALERLQRQDLIGQGQLEAFYVRLSSIVRRYVELRFGLRAPEQTSEEFLSAVLTTGGLLRTHRDLLQTFLQHCDLVKFARHQPTPSDMEDALQSATTFVQQTADAQVLVTVPASGQAPL